MLQVVPAGQTEGSVVQLGGCPQKPSRQSSPSAQSATPMHSMQQLSEQYGVFPPQVPGTDGSHVVSQAKQTPLALQVSPAAMLQSESLVHSAQKHRTGSQIGRWVLPAH